jgi:hypothetical protein
LVSQKGAQKTCPSNAEEYNLCETHGGCMQEKEGRLEMSGKKIILKFIEKFFIGGVTISLLVVLLLGSFILVSLYSLDTLQEERRDDDEDNARDKW